MLTEMDKNCFALQLSSRRGFALGVFWTMRTSSACHRPRAASPSGGRRPPLARPLLAARASGARRVRARRLRPRTPPPVAGARRACRRPRAAAGGPPRLAAAPAPAAHRPPGPRAPGPPVPRPLAARPRRPRVRRTPLARPPLAARTSARAASAAASKDPLGEGGGRGCARRAAMPTAAHRPRSHSSSVRHSLQRRRVCRALRPAARSAWPHADRIPPGSARRSPLAPPRPAAAMP